MSIEAIQQERRIIGIKVIVIKDGPQAAKLLYWDKQLTKVLDKIQNCLELTK